MGWKFTGMKPMESVKKSSKSKRSSIKRVKVSLRITSPRVRFVVCVKSGGFVDLEPLKVYKVRRDLTAKAQRLIRVVDGSGEDDLYPVEFFRPIRATQRLFKIVELLALEPALQ